MNGGEDEQGFGMSGLFVAPCIIQQSDVLSITLGRWGEMGRVNLCYS